MFKVIGIELDEKGYFNAWLDGPLEKFFSPRVVGVEAFFHKDDDVYDPFKVSLLLYDELGNVLDSGPLAVFEEGLRTPIMDVLWGVQIEARSNDEG